VVVEVLQALQDVALCRACAGGGVEERGAAAAAAASTSAAVLALLEPLICHVLMPAAGRQLPGFRGKALVRCALQALAVIAGSSDGGRGGGDGDSGALVPEQEWGAVWAAIGGTFWLSRCAVAGCMATGTGAS
jgi:microcystin degradation protein MlrC